MTSSDERCNCAVHGERRAVLRGRMIYLQRSTEKTVPATERDRRNASGSVEDVSQIWNDPAVAETAVALRLFALKEDGNILHIVFTRQSARSHALSRSAELTVVGPRIQTEYI